MELIKQLIGLKESNDFATIKAAVLKAVDISMVRHAQGADVYVHGSNVHWAVEYEFAEHADDLEADINKAMGNLGKVEIERSDMDDEEDEGPAAFGFDLHLNINLTPEQVEELTSAISKKTIGESVQESSDGVMDSDAYMKMLDDGAVEHFESMISEEGFEAMDNGNISVAIHDITSNPEVDFFSKYGLDLDNHADIVKLVKSIEKYGF